ncbi:MAG: YdcF family protein [FCB group bacterium]|jgi:uncharacterized SAM-binding protein YcdF (DUF218 family)|nr:YdcF family protein [FCB group bacterium]
MSTPETEAKERRSWPRKLLKWAIPSVLGFLILFPLYQMASIYAYGFARDKAPADAAVVMGAAEYNNRPSPVFKERIEHAISLYKEGRVRALVFTGGSGKGSKYAEAQVGRDYAVKRGVPADKAFLENVSRITYDNLREARKIVAREKFKRVLIVSDPLHMKRSVVMARDLGMDAHPSPTPTSQFKTWRTKGPLLLHETYYYCLYAVGRYFLD